MTAVLKITEDQGKFRLHPKDDSIGLAPDDIELCKVVERVQQECTYTQHAVSAVREIADKVSREALTATEALKAARNAEQELEASIKKIKSPFTVFAIDEKGNPLEYPDSSVKIVDILIRTEDLNVSEEKADFQGRG